MDAQTTRQDYTARQVRLIPIPIGLIISLFAYLISSIGNGGDNRAAAHFKAGNNEFDRGSFAQAIARYADAIECKPDFWEAYYNRGLAYLNSNDRDRALADFDRALQLNPGFARGYFSRGVAYYTLKENGKAIADFDQAVARTPEFIARRWTDAAQNSDGQRSATLPGYLNGSPDEIDLPRVYVYRGLAYVEHGDDEKALVDMDKAVELQPTLSFAYYARGVARFNMGDYEGALTDFGKVLKLDNNPVLSAEVKALLDALGMGIEITPWTEGS